MTEGIVFAITAKEFTDAYLDSKRTRRLDTRTEYEKLVSQVNEGLVEAVRRMECGEYVRVIRVMQEPLQPRELFARLYEDLRAAGFFVTYYRARVIPNELSGKGFHGDFLEIETTITDDC